MPFSTSLVKWFSTHIFVQYSIASLTIICFFCLFSKLDWSLYFNCFLSFYFFLRSVSLFILTAFFLSFFLSLISLELCFLLLMLGWFSHIDIMELKMVYYRLKSQNLDFFLGSTITRLVFHPVGQTEGI